MMKPWLIICKAGPFLVFLVLRRACGATERMGWSFFSFAPLNLPTCDWLGCSRALKPRSSASSAALVDEPGSDGQKPLDPLWPLSWLWAALSLDLRTLCPRHSIKSSGSAATQQGADGSVHGTPWGARERQPSPRAPSVHPTRFRLVGLRPASEVWGTVYLCTQSCWEWKTSGRARI